MPTRVIILGGGVAGMSAAHELIERGFEVVVLERRDIAGGKARSIPRDPRRRGHQRTPARRRRQGIDRAPCARRAWISVLPGVLQARHRHHAPYSVVRRAQGGGSPRADDAHGHHAVRKAHLCRTGGLSAHAQRCRRTAARHSCCVRADHRPHARRFGVLRRAHLADPHLMRRAPARGVRAERAGGSSSAPSSGRRRTRSSSRRASRARWWPPRRARPARARSATYSCN